MRRPLVLAGVLAAVIACASRDRPATRGPSATGANGPDPILIRLPHAGGTAHAFRWGSDSAIWSSTGRVPALDRVLAFDDEQGSLAYVDARGAPGRLDLRVGSADAAAPVGLVSLTSADGWAVYGLNTKHDVSRLTPSGTWTFSPAPTPRTLVPVADGSLVLVDDDGRRMTLQRLHPPEPRVMDTASVPSTEIIVRPDLGDRLYFLGDSGLAGVRVRDLARTKTVRLPTRGADAVATPSGDRIFVALRGRKTIALVDRYAESVDRTIDIPGEAAALRMDPDGRYLLARDAHSDAVYIVSVATSKVVATVKSDWRADLPFVAPDSTVALAQGPDVVVTEIESGRERSRVAGGATDLWVLIRWNGFRPRAAGLDEPVRFAEDSDSTASPAVIDSTLVANVAPALVAGASPMHIPDSVAKAAEAPPRGTNAPARQFTLSFAALLSEDRANTMAAAIKVDGHPVRVVPGVRDGTPIYRIVYGPFNTRDDADKAGRRSGLPYWVYEGAP